MKKIKGIVAIVLSVMTMGVFCSCGSTGAMSYSQAEIPLSGQTSSNNNSFKNVSIGDIIKFGAYEQDNNISNGKEEIEWQVLAKEGNMALVISKYALDCQPYNTSDTDVTWETCSLRKWLNVTFLSNAFSSDEQKMIQETTVTADKNPKYDTPPGNDTTEKVFSLSISEVNKFFSTDEARRCAPTKYTKAHFGDYLVDDKAGCWWWLRSPGSESNRAAFVSLAGTVGNSGNSGEVVAEDYAVRPAMWINLDSLIF